jgi:hypothetical protein
MRAILSPDAPSFQVPVSQDGQDVFVFRKEKFNILVYVLRNFEF